ncbi:MAG: HU family DNA-binding protein [Bacteroidaceae bacterium]|nr:HU family DNA-binding protein [Bacteroidaceae bacterium]
MAVMYKLYQNNRKNFVNRGHWYARAINTQTTDMKKVAQIIQRNCTAKYSDVLAVLTELVEVMQDELQASHAVKLDGFGTFKIGLNSSGAAQLDKFSAAKNIKGLHVVFTPEGKRDANGKMTRTFLTGCTVREAPKNAVGVDAESNNSGNTGSGDGNNGSTVNP